MSVPMVWFNLTDGGHCAHVESYYPEAQVVKVWRGAHDLIEVPKSIVVAINPKARDLYPALAEGAKVVGP